MNAICKPTKYDVVLGGKNDVPVSDAVLGGIPGLRKQLQSVVPEHRTEALYATRKYKEQGVKLLEEILYSGELGDRLTAYTLLESNTSIIDKFCETTRRSPESCLEDLLVLSDKFRANKTKNLSDIENDPQAWQVVSAKLNTALKELKTLDVSLTKNKSHCLTDRTDDVLMMVFDFSPFKSRNIRAAAYAEYKIYIKGKTLFLGREWWYSHYLLDGIEVETVQNYYPNGNLVATGIRYRLFDARCDVFASCDWIRIGTYRSQESVERKAWEQLLVYPRYQKKLYIVNEPVLSTKKIRPKYGKARSFKTGKWECYQEIPTEGKLELPKS
jgi:hypothetical protein